MQLITLTDVKTFLDTRDMVAHDTLLTSIIDQTSGRIEAYLNRRLTESAYTQYFNGGKKRYYLDAYPIATSPAAVIQVNGSTKTEDSDYYVWHDLGLIEFKHTVSDVNPKDVSIQWTGGYAADATTGALAVPDALKEACTLQSVFLYRRRDSLGINSISTPDGSISTNAPTKLLPEVIDILNMYRKAPGEF